MNIHLDTHPDMNKVAGGWEIETTLVFDKKYLWQVATLGQVVKASNGKGFAGIMVDALDEADCDKLIKLFLDSHIAAPVSVQGRQDHPDDRTGSVRATGWSQHLADELWSKMGPMLSVRQTDEYAPTDWWQGTPGHTWKPVGISPMLRFMKYEEGGQHYAHYDAGFIYPDNKHRTLQSFVLYLTTNTDAGGSTRFIKDGQADVKTPERDLNDWLRETDPSEVITSVHPKKGNILFFDHRLCHDVEKYSGTNSRIIVRGDIIYESIKPDEQEK